MARLAGGGWPTAGSATARSRRPATPCRRSASSACSRRRLLGPIAAVIALDRIGKGIRTPPRDALISLSQRAASVSASPSACTAPSTRRRAARPAGRLRDAGAGCPTPSTSSSSPASSSPWSAWPRCCCSSATRGASRAAACRRGRATAGAPHGADRRCCASRAFARSPGPARRWRCYGGRLLLLPRCSAHALEPHLFPLLYVGTALACLLLAVPAGRLADRIGRGPVFLLGHGLLLAACLPLAAPAGASGTRDAGAARRLLRLHRRRADGLAPAPCVPERLRATGLAVLATAIGLSRLLASPAFGAAWDRCGLERRCGGFALALALAAAAHRAHLAACGRPRAPRGDARGPG